MIILTYNESIHIQRCIQSILPLEARVLVVDSFSTDDTCSLAKELGVEVVQNTFFNQAQQFQWAMDNCRVTTDWVLRLDADELIEQDLQLSIRHFLDQDGDGHNGAIFLRKHIFLGRWVKYGGRYPLPMLRLFRLGTARVEQRWMDEHIVLEEGQACTLKGGFRDENLHSVSWFIDKHNKYASREMLDILLVKLGCKVELGITENTGSSIRIKRFLKFSLYMKLPYFVRPFIYFCYRYFLQLGFLDGSRGFAYHFMQGFWYRVLVDLKCMEVERLLVEGSSLNDKLIKLQEVSGIDLSRYMSDASS